MFAIALKTNVLWCILFILGTVVGMSTQANSSLILSTITSRAPSSSRSSSLSATTTFSGYLSWSSPAFARPYGTAGLNYYYQAVEVTVYQFGVYSLTTSSFIDTYGCLYDTIFDPSNPLRNLIACDDDSGSSAQFLINANLQSGRTYILVVTTSSPSVTGSYSLLASGSYSVSLRGVTTVTTTKSGYLYSGNPEFSRPGGYSSHYYYESIRVTASTSGLYSFRSSSASSTDLYGCLYSGSFDPSSSSWNQLICDDDSAGGLQFQFSQSLYASNTYILVVTTSSSYTTGSYSVAITGPASVSLTTITPSGLILPLTAIVSIAVSCVSFCVLITLAIWVCRRRRRQQLVVPVCTTYGTYPKL